MTLHKDCQARVARIRSASQGLGITGQAPYPPSYSAQEALHSVAHRLAWDAGAAGEFPRPMLSDATDVELLAPELSDDVWHHVAGATILGGYCCGTPAAHRDALIRIASELHTSARVSA